MAAAVAPASVVSVVPVMPVAVSLTRSRLAAVARRCPRLGRGEGLESAEPEAVEGVREREELGAELELSREESE